MAAVVGSVAARAVNAAAAPPGAVFDAVVPPGRRGRGRAARVVGVLGLVAGAAQILTRLVHPAAHLVLPAAVLLPA